MIRMIYISFSGLPVRQWRDLRGRVEHPEGL